MITAWVVVGSILTPIAIIILVICAKRESEEARYKPKYRGTFYSSRFGCAMADMRSDAEMQADANRVRQ